MALRREDIPLYLTGAAAVSALISIAACEILIGAAIVAMFATRTPLANSAHLAAVHRYSSPELCFRCVANGHYHQGWPQIRKFYVYAMLFLVASVFRTAAQLRWLALWLRRRGRAFRRLGAESVL